MYEHRSESLAHVAETAVGSLKQVAEGQEGSNNRQSDWVTGLCSLHEEFWTGSWEVLERLLNRRMAWTLNVVYIYILFFPRCVF